MGGRQATFSPASKLSGREPGVAFTNLAEELLETGRDGIALVDIRI